LKNLGLIFKLKSTKRGVMV